jgi:hypothetical protein
MLYSNLIPDKNPCLLLQSFHVSACDSTDIAVFAVTTERL